MAFHLPLVRIGGRNKQLPAGDQVAGGVPAGGTAGQVLSKIDGAAYNAQWVTSIGGIRSVAISYAASLTLDAANYDHFRVGALTGSITALNLTGGTDGQRIVCLLPQDGTGGRTVTLGTSILLSVDLPSFSATTGADKVDLLAFIYDATLGKYLLTAVNKGYN